MWIAHLAPYSSQGTFSDRRGRWSRRVAIRSKRTWILCWALMGIITKTVLLNTWLQCGRSLIIWNPWRRAWFSRTHQTMSVKMSPQFDVLTGPLKDHKSRDFVCYCSGLPWLDAFWLRFLEPHVVLTWCVPWACADNERNETGGLVSLLSIGPTFNGAAFRTGGSVVTHRCFHEQKHYKESPAQIKLHLST